MIALQLGAGGRHHVRRANPYLCMCCIVQGYACASNTECGCRWSVTQSAVYGRLFGLQYSRLVG